MEMGFCHICSTRNAPEDKKCKRCGTELINLDRSSNMSQGIRSGLISGLITAIITSILFSLYSIMEKNDNFFECLFILIAMNIIKGLAIGAIAGKTGTLCFYKNIQAIGPIIDILFLIIAISQYGYLKEIGMITKYRGRGGGMHTNAWYIWFLSGSLIAPLASYIEKKYFRKMTWL